MNHSPWREGGCHCGAVRFRVRARLDRGLTCNCSICHMQGFVHLIVRSDDFQLLCEADVLSSYRFNSGIANHLFCRHCGISSFYVPRSHPDGFSVNMRCLDRLDLGDVVLSEFDGQRWEQNIDSISGYGADDAP